MGTVTSMMMGVADMPIQTLKLLQIHPDSRSRKGKERANGTEATPSVDSDRSGRPPVARTITNTTNASAASGASTPPGVADSAPGRLSRSDSDNTAVAGHDVAGTPNHRSTFMSQAFEESTGGSRSSSRDRARHHTHGGCEIAERLHHRRTNSSTAVEQKSNNGTAADSPGITESMESAVDTGKGLARIIGAGFKSPMDFSLNVAKGFHNVPKLYGAEVRQVDKVTDLQSGLRTAAKV